MTQSSPRSAIAMNRSKQRRLEEPRKRVSTTCTNCRERHLKCDGGPVCSRCRADDRQCVFILSRRGRRPSVKHDTINKAARLSDLRSSTKSEGDNVETGSESAIPEESNQSPSRSSESPSLPSLSKFSAFFIRTLSSRVFYIRNAFNAKYSF